MINVDHNIAINKAIIFTNQIRFKAMIQGKPLYHKYLEELKEKPYKRMGPPKELFQKSKYYQKKWYENESSLNRC